MMNVALQMIIYCVILVVLAIPLGSYMGTGSGCFCQGFCCLWKT